MPFVFFFLGHQACFSFRTFLLEFILLSKAWHDSYKFHRLNNRQLDHPEGGFASSIINLLMSVEQNLWGSHHLEQFEPPLMCQITFVILFNYWTVESRPKRDLIYMVSHALVLTNDRISNSASKATICGRLGKLLQNECPSFLFEIIIFYLHSDHSFWIIGFICANFFYSTKTT